MEPEYSDTERMYFGEPEVALGDAALDLQPMQGFDDELAEVQQHLQLQQQEPQGPHTLSPVDEDESAPASVEPPEVEDEASSGEAGERRGQPPVLCLSHGKVFLAAAFTWLEDHGVTEADVWKAGHAAFTVLEGSTDGKPLEPCAKCCRSGKPNVVVGLTAGTKAVSVKHSDGLVEFVFDRCKSRCNSSRLHLGGRVLLSMNIKNKAGELVVCVKSSPLALCSKPSANAAAGSRPGRKKRAEAASAAAVKAAPSEDGAPASGHQTPVPAQPPEDSGDAAPAEPVHESPPHTAMVQNESVKLQFLEQVQVGQLLQLLVLQGILQGQSLKQPEPEVEQPRRRLKGTSDGLEQEKEEEVQAGPSQLFLHQ
eukprot:m51a1_g13736 hypothetical protein (367) ;mRNA; r:153741-155195